MVRQSLRLGVEADDLELSFLLHAGEVDAPAAGVAEELALALLVAEQDRFLARGHAACEEICYQQRLARSGRAADQRHAVAKEAAAAHFVDCGIAARYTYHAGLLLQAQRRERNCDHALMRQQRERGFTLGVMAAAHLENLDGAAALFPVQHVAQDDDVIGDELFQPVPGDFAVLAVALCGHEYG